MAKICTTCAETIEVPDYFYLNASSYATADVSLKHLLQTCIPEFDIDLLDDSLICRNCTSALHIAYSFRNTVLNNKKTLSISSEAEANVNDFIAIDTIKTVRTAKRLFRCEKCDFRHDSKAGLTMHERIHSGETPYHCSVCSYKAKRKSHLEDHAKTHWNVRPFRCDVCSNDFATKQILRKHERIHTGEKPYTCLQCGFRARYKNVIANHVRKEHFDENVSAGDKCVCEVCGRLLAGPASLNAHMRIHTGVKKYLCELCGKYFREVGMLNTHLLLHSGEKPFKCGDCDYGAARKAHLLDHMKTHVGIRRLEECDDCGKQYASKCLLRKHKKLHDVVDNDDCLT